MPFRKILLNSRSFEFSKNGSFASNKRKKRAFARTGVSNPAAGLPPNAANDSRGDKQGWVMRFILRMAFWLTVILVLLPSGGSQPTPKVNVSASDAVSAAGATVSDMKQFCGRQSKPARSDRRSRLRSATAPRPAPRCYTSSSTPNSDRTTPARSARLPPASATIAAYAHGGRPGARVARGAAASRSPPGTLGPAANP